MADRIKEKKHGTSNSKAMLAPYEVEAEMVRAKTARLRELRLAKEAAELAAGGGPAPAKAPVERAPAVKKKSGKSGSKGKNLADWLETEQSQGRRN